MRGELAALTAGADPIRFQLNLPFDWNRKALMVGGGGFNGSLVDAMAPLRDAAAGQALPIAQGFATFGTDSGHDATSYNATDPARFALNDEMLENFAHASYKKTRDAAHVVMTRYYGQAPDRQYFYGGSEGGREGLTMAQRYPTDFDGIVSIVPVIHWSGLFNSFLAFSRPQAQGGALSSAQIDAIARTVNTVCDSLDGLADGVINNTAACAQRMDLNLLACPQAPAATCLSPAQMATVRAVYAPTPLSFAQANGLTSYPARLFGGEIQPGGEGLARWVTTGRAPTSPTPLATDARGWIYGNSYARYLIAQDPAIDPLTMDLSAYAPRLREISALMDSTNPDLSAFHAAGGKLILRENAGDMAQSAAAGIDYVAAVRERLGSARTDDFLRLYVSPASSHGGSAASLTDGRTIPTNIDLLSVLDDWVEDGTAPGDLVQVSRAAQAPHAITASRPLCQYPGYPHYRGGDVQAASSYACQAPATR